MEEERRKREGWGREPGTTYLLGGSKYAGRSASSDVSCGVEWILLCCESFSLSLSLTSIFLVHYTF